MADAMVTARIPQSKKDAGNEVLREPGHSESQAVNEPHDRLSETHSLPFAPEGSSGANHAELAEALAFVDSIAQANENNFVDMSADDAKRSRLIAKGRATEADFAQTFS